MGKIQSGAGEVLPIMAYMGRFPPKGVPFPGFRYMKGLGNLSLRSVKRTKSAHSRILWLCKRQEKFLVW